ncbi:uncharacterized protein JCM15063_004379 [Sporobolomyces koalae]|uniref:uncharacterized protein n=1 Tax=Sporobolomyces koalae TaxID=500713 RepID=UPI003181B0FA
MSSTGDSATVPRSPQPHIILNDTDSSRESHRSTSHLSPASLSWSASLSHSSRSNSVAAPSSRSRQRSISPGPANTMQALDALAGTPPPASATSSSSNKIPPLPTLNAFASRPSPVVPPSPNVGGSPHHFVASRPTSPRPSRHVSEEPASPTRERTGNASSATPMLGEGAASAGMGRSASQVDLSHIFERDVEFASTHHITPSEAVDVAVPPVLTEAIIALSDPVVSHDVEALIHESEADAQAGSGWSSPIIPPTASQLNHAHHAPQAASRPHAHQHSPASPSAFSHSSYANASRSPGRPSHARSFSPDSVDGIEALSSGGEDRRAASPGGSSTTFSGGSPPTSAGEISPPTTSAGGTAFGLGPFGKKLAEALESEANKLPPGLVGTTTLPSPPSRSLDSTSAASDKPGMAPLRPSNLLSPQSLSVPFPASSSAITDQPTSSFVASPLASPGSEVPINVLPAGANTNPHPRRLSFISYADVINEERMAELTGEGAATGTATPAIGKGPKGGIGAELVEGRLASLLLGDQ